MCYIFIRTLTNKCFVTVFLVLVYMLFYALPFSLVFNFYFLVCCRMFFIFFSPLDVFVFFSHPVCAFNGEQYRIVKFININRYMQNGTNPNRSREQYILSRPFYICCLSGWLFPPFLPAMWWFKHVCMRSRMYVCTVYVRLFFPFFINSFVFIVFIPLTSTSFSAFTAAFISSVLVPIKIFLYINFWHLKKREKK